MTLKNRNFFRREEIFVRRIAEDRKDVLLVRHLCAKRIDDTDAAPFVGARQGMMFVAPLEELVNDDALVNNFDGKIAGAQTITVEIQRDRKSVVSGKSVDLG